MFVALLMLVTVLTGCGGTSTPASQAPASQAPASQAPASQAPTSQAPASNSSYPTRQIELIAPFAAGGSVDLNCRIIAPLLEKELGGTVVVVNKPGASGVLGFTYIGMAKPDGYTIGLGNLFGVTSNAAQGNFKMDPATQLEYLGGVVVDTVVLAAAADSPFDTFQDVVDYLKEHPEDLSYAATGAQSMDGLMMVDMENVAGIEMNMVTFDGGSESVAALLGGHVDLWGTTVSESLSYYQSGEIKVLAVGGKERAAEMPDAPTFAEQGYPLSVNAAQRALFMAVDSDPEILKTLRDAVKSFAESDEYKQQCADMGVTPTYMSPEECVETVNTLMAFFAENL